jgi:hypothetical protein
MVHILDGGGYGIKIPTPQDNPPKVKPGKGGSTNIPASLKATVGDYEHSGTGLKTISGITTYTPKALISFGTMNGLFDTVEPAEHVGFGVATSPTQRLSSAACASDNDTAEDGSDAMAERALIQISTSPSNYHLQSELDAFLSTGFRLNVVEDDFPVGNRELYLTLGGSNLQAKCGYKDVPAATLGNLSVTDIGFRPDVVLLFGYNSSNILPIFNGGGVHFGVGAFDAAGRQWWTYIANADIANTSDTARYMSTSKCLAGIGYSVLQVLGAVEGECSFVSMNANGFTINIDTVLGGQRKFGYLALRGLRARVGNFVTPAVPGTSTITEPGFRPAAVLLSSVGCVVAELGTKVTYTFMGISAIASNGARAIGLWDQDNAGTSVAKRWMSATQVGQVREPGADHHLGAATLTNQGFNIIWAEADWATPVGYIALG